METCEPTKTMIFILLTFAFVLIMGNAAGDSKHHHNHFAHLPQCCLSPDCVGKPGDTGDCVVDIVIAGCGSSGSVMSNLLTQQTPLLKGIRHNFSVLCLERGKYYNNDAAI